MTLINEPINIPIVINIKPSTFKAAKKYGLKRSAICRAALEQQVQLAAEEHRSVKLKKIRLKKKVK